MAIQINNTTVIDDSRNIQNVGVGTITTLNATGVVATAERTTWSQVGSGLTFTTGIATNFTVSGVGTITTLNATGVVATSNRSTWSQVGSGLTFTTGIGTFLNVTGIATAANLNVTGIGTVGNIAFRSNASGGIITATTGIVTYFGDGSRLSGISVGLAVSSGITTSLVHYLTFVSSGSGSTTGFGVSVGGLTYIPSSNQLGIGTINPNAALHVVDDILVSTGVAATLDTRIKSYSNEGGSISFEDAVDGSSIFTLQQGDSDILFDVSTSPTNQVFQVGIDSSIIISSGVSTADFKIKAYDEELGALSFEDSVDATQYFSVTQDISTLLFGVNDANLNTIFSVNANSSANARLGSVAEKLTRVDGNTVNISYESSTGSNIGICTNPSGNITLNVTNIPTSSDFDNCSITFSAIVINAGTARTFTAVNFNGVSRTVFWTNGVGAAGSTSGYSKFDFIGINTVGSASTTANYVVLGTSSQNFR